MKKLFGTDGMRGLAGEFPLDAKTIEIVGESLTKHMRETLGRNPRFVTGRDTRESGAWIEKAFCKGAAGAGAICESAEVITTPGVAFLTKKLNFDAGVVISASHNPFEDNGIKIFSPSGKKLDEATEKKIENDIRERDGENASSSGSGDTYEVENSKASSMQKLYLDYLANEFKNLSLANVKIAVDCANGAASNLAPPLFQGFGADVKVFNCEPNGRNINKDCGSLHLEKLQQNVLEEKADFGVAFDGDADRSLFVDEKGNLVDGDVVLWIMAQHLQEENMLANATVVATVMSNIGLELALETKNIKLTRTSVGDKYVLSELLATNSSIGGEQSGHIIFPNKSLVGDGIMTSLYLLEALRAKNQTLSEAVKGFTRFPQILVNVKVNEKRPFEDVAEISETSARIEEKLGTAGRLLLRYSGTENLARVMIEGKDQDEIENYANQLAQVIKKSLT